MAEETFVNGEYTYTLEPIKDKKSLALHLINVGPLWTENRNKLFFDASSTNSPFRVYQYNDPEPMNGIWDIDYLYSRKEIKTYILHGVKLVDERLMTQEDINSFDAPYRENVFMSDFYNKETGSMHLPHLISAGIYHRTPEAAQLACKVRLGLITESPVNGG